MNEKIRGLDGLKGIAAIFIAYVYHYCILFAANPFSSNVVMDKLFCGINIYAGYGEAVFFLMSGFLMSYVYKKRIKKQGWKEFFLPRMKRIYPLMIATVMVVFAFENLGKLLLGEYPLYGVHGEIQYGWGSLLLSVLGLQTGYISDGDLHSVNGPAWYISILFLCYMISYVFIKKIKNEKHLLFSIFFMFLLGVVIAANHGFSVPLFYSCCGRGFVGFFLGMLMEYFVDVKKPISPLVSILLIGEIVGMLYLIEALWSPQKMVLTELFVYPTSLYLVLKSPGIQNLLDKKIPRYIGRISYHIYLLNFPILVGIAFISKLMNGSLDYNNPLVWLGITAGSLFISSVVYRGKFLFLKS
ncbi:MAG: acyltransferase [Lachnospiraceae bacterium]|nr:acyltransferase [Lachnospiraceae bacterium]